MDQGAEPGAPEGAVGVVDRSEHQALAGGRVRCCDGAQRAAGEGVTVQGEAAAITKAQALDQSEGYLLGEKVGDRVDSHEAEVDGDLERPAAHDRVGGEVSGQRGMRADDGG